MLPWLNKRRAVTLLISAAVTAAALWAYGFRMRREPTTAPRPQVAIQDGKTIDFSNGTAVVKDTPADKAAMDAAVKAMDAAASTVTFPATAQAKK
jgi:hypothetical protein